MRHNRARWTGETLRGLVEAAARDAGVRLTDLSLSERLAFETALERQMAPYADLTICSECREVGLEYVPEGG